MADITDEVYWDREIVTAELEWCGDELCRRTGRPASAVGTKGNEAHRRGSHRSQEWILKSEFCTSRTYTVQAGLTALQARHIAGLDFIPDVWGTARNRALMIEQTKRLLAAMKAGLLPEVLQLFGTVDGKTVTGWDNRTNKVITADDSHLDHWHAGIDRTQLNNRALMERIVNIALGDDMSELDTAMATATTNRTDGLFGHKPSVKYTITVDGKKQTRTETNELGKVIDGIAGGVAELLKRPTGEPVPADLLAIKAAVRDVLQEPEIVAVFEAAFGRVLAAAQRAGADAVAPPA